MPANVSCLTQLPSNAHKGVLGISCLSFFTSKWGCTPLKNIIAPGDRATGKTSARCVAWVRKKPVSQGEHKRTFATEYNAANSIVAERNIKAIGQNKETGALGRGHRFWLKRKGFLGYNLPSSIKLMSRVTMLAELLYSEVCLMSNSGLW